MLRVAGAPTASQRAPCHVNAGAAGRDGHGFGLKLSCLEGHAASARFAEHATRARTAVDESQPRARLTMLRSAALHTERAPALHHSSHARLALRRHRSGRHASLLLAAVSLLLAASTAAAPAEQQGSAAGSGVDLGDAPRRMLRAAPAPAAGIAPAPAADAPALAPQGAAVHHLHRNSSRTNSTGTNSSSSSSSSSDAAASSSSMTASLQNKLRTVLVLSLAGGFFVFAYITLTPNYVFCPTFCPLLLIW